MTEQSIEQNRYFTEVAANLVLTLAWRAFVATQCRALPSDIHNGIIAILGSDNGKKSA